MAKRPDGFLRAFMMSATQMNEELSRVERENGIELRHLPTGRARWLSEFDQFETEVRRNAARMSELYEVFFCLENSIRDLVSTALFESEGAEWWRSKRVDETRIRKPCGDRRDREVGSGVTPRSDRPIDYTTFGELSQLITDNWDIFAPVFSSKTAVSNITNQLNVLRGPIAHCVATDELEQERLSLAVRSWFKLQT
jgi:hypothetical protein